MTIRQRAQTLMMPALPQAPEGLSEDLYKRLMADLEENAERRAIERMQPVIEAERAKAEAAEARLEAVNVSRETLQKELESANKRIDDLITQGVVDHEAFEGEREEHNSRYEQNDHEMVEAASKIQSLRQEIAVLQERLNQPKPQPKIIQSAPAVIPSFNIEPVRDAAGNLISAKVIPIGGN